MKHLYRSLFLFVFLAACHPTPGITEVGETAVSIINGSPSPILSTVIPGCGPGVITPEDALCYLTAIDSSQVQRIDVETAVLLANPDTIADWAGAAVIYHEPTSSMLVLDKFGDVDPQAGVFSSRAGLAALNKVAGNAELMAGLKQQMQIKWQTTPPNEPEIRLSTAWQDGDTTMFLIAVAGLESADDRFYCAGETWTIGDNTVEIAYDCIAHEAGTPVNHVLFASQQIQGAQERPVQVALNGVASNVVQVREGEVAQETAVYLAALVPHTGRPLIIRGETFAGFDPDADLSETAVAPNLRQNYLTANEIPFSLWFLFQNSSAYFVHPSASIERDYLLDGETPSACAQFRRDYPGLGGIITLSRIGISDDGMQAMVHVLHECGALDRTAAYYLLTSRDDKWQIVKEFTAATALPVLIPEMEYVNRANGCGDMFVYKSNRAGSEFITVSIRADAFDFSTGPTMIDLKAHPETVGIRIDVYADREAKLDQFPYCNDVGQTAVAQSVWQAVSGRVIVTAVTGIQAEPCEGSPYQTTIVIEDVVFALGEETIRLPSLSFEDVTVGWCPG